MKIFIVVKYTDVEVFGMCGDCNVWIGETGVVTDISVGAMPYEVETNGVTWVWSENNLKLVNKETNTSQNESINGNIASQEIHSDGGSSDYYFTSLPKHLIDQIVETGGIEIKDIIRYVFDNNADAFNIVKAQKRIVESLKGKGKAGITSLYDANKIRFFAEEQYNALNNKES